MEQQIQETFPAESFRKYQKSAAKMVLEDLNSGTDVAVLSAPTGFGKSLVLETIGQINGPTFYATPLNTLIDQLVNDEHIGHRVYEMKGQNNYYCARDDVPADTKVSEAPCQTGEESNCDLKDTECPYYSRKLRLQDEAIICTNVSYLMLEGQQTHKNSDGRYSFGDRATLIIDECQRLEDFALNHAQIELSPDELPQKIWARTSIPDHGKYEDEQWAGWVEKTLVDAMETRTQELLDSPGDLSPAQRTEYDTLQDQIWRLKYFVKNVETKKWVANKRDIQQNNGPDYTKITLKPTTVDSFLRRHLWDRADNIILSSATVPGDDNSSGDHKWLSDIGLAHYDTKQYSIPHTFPVRNRPIYAKEAVGKMTYDERDTTIPHMADKIKELATQQHAGENGIIHCRSYGIANSLYEEFNNRFQNNIELQASYGRQASLERWKNNDTPLFFSVNMSEGIDLEGDTCRWQAVAKTLYPHMGDARVSYRVEEQNDWHWYNQQAAIQLQQAYGRAVRGPTDNATMYLLDSSAKQLIRRNAELFQEWFLDAIQDMRIDAKRGI